MRKLTKVELIKALLQDAGFETEYCSPNLVAHFAANRDINLSSAEIIIISNEYTLDGDL